MNLRKIKKKHIVISIILLGLIVGFSYDLYTKNQMKNDVVAYLVNEGYQEEEISEISVHWSKPSTRPTASVIFKEEPDKVYFYMYDNEQIEPSGTSK
ncbi:DUF3139 domain-containing protein [Saliterribacillus persicus]|uniref:Uncharacterized protein DUF3139 n=1 Tax=Saliterribacillus persicus TaxID=930114 RepID=A0A368X6N5_9BACI|nr:DUF3139 domain-containing protein [Saliterribacillus persicus]RCW63369.1 uncharacterized protein DUF3139 [Saliterribacillus persicus]